MKNESDDDRQKGVAVIVSINKLRNDAWKLPEDILDKAELQVPAALVRIMCMYINCTVLLTFKRALAAAAGR